VRWEIGRFDAFGHDLDKMTDQRLCSKFRVTNRREMTSEQLRYCYDYHIAMVEPFTDNRSWWVAFAGDSYSSHPLTRMSKSRYRLQYAAGRSWAKIFNRFCNLESISVGCCDIVDQPSPTVTNTFVLQHGKGVIEEPHPPYIEDGAVNMAWASALVIRTAPRTVRDLRLSMANMDNFNSFATINRLQSVIQHGRFTTRTMMITRLSITLRGIAGTHGNKEWHGDTGSAGSVRHWTTLLNSLEQLQHLEFHNALDASGILQFSHMELSDAKGCILDWILPELASRHLRTLRLCGFLLDEASILNTLADRWVSLQNLILEDISLMLRYTENSHAAEQQRRDSYGDHLQGKSWLNIGRILTEDHPGVCIVLKRIASNVNEINDYALHPRYVKQLEALPLVEVDVAEPPSAWLKPPKDHHETEPEAS
jgi:hypothetical protein